MNGWMDGWMQPTVLRPFHFHGGIVTFGQASAKPRPNKDDVGLPPAEHKSAPAPPAATNTFMKEYTQWTESQLAL